MTTNKRKSKPIAVRLKLYLHDDDPLWTRIHQLLYTAIVESRSAGSLHENLHPRHEVTIIGTVPDWLMADANFPGPLKP